jgi:hypothetical protein
MCARGEALGGRLVAWSAALLAMAWEPEAVEEAIELATSLREETSAPERAWTCGVAEGQLEALAPDGQRMSLAWGEALVSAASLARIAKAGEVLVDGDLGAMRAGQLAVIGARSATDAGQRVRGWRLDLDRPWKNGPPVLAELEAEERDASAATQVLDPEDTVATQILDPEDTVSTQVLDPDDTAATQILDPEETASTQILDREENASTQVLERRGPLPAPTPVPRFESHDETLIITVDELEVVVPPRGEQHLPSVIIDDDDDLDDDEVSTGDVLQVIEASALQAFQEEPSTSERRREGTLAEKVRALSEHPKNRDPVVAIADLRRARQRAQSATPSARCQASLALAMALSIAGRSDEALLETLDALASARTADDAKAVNACVALLAKLYAGAGFPDAGRTLKETAEGG